MEFNVLCISHPLVECATRLIIIFSIVQFVTETKEKLFHCGIYFRFFLLFVIILNASSRGRGAMATRWIPDPKIGGSIPLSFQRIIYVTMILGIFVAGHCWLSLSVNISYYFIDSCFDDDVFEVRQRRYESTKINFSII